MDFLNMCIFIAMFLARLGIVGGIAAMKHIPEPNQYSDYNLLAFSIYRDEFTQEGPSGPIEAKRILMLRALPNVRTRVSFELDPVLSEQLGFCQPPPLLLEHRQDARPTGVGKEISIM